MPEAATPAAGPSSDGEVAPQGPAQGRPRRPGRAAAGGAGGRGLRRQAVPRPAGPSGRTWRAASSPAGQRSAAVPVSPPSATRTAPTETVPELDLGNVMVPVLLRRFGPVVAACAVTAVVTWVIARRR